MDGIPEKSQANIALEIEEVNKRKKALLDELRLLEKEKSKLSYSLVTDYKGKYIYIESGGVFHTYLHVTDQLVEVLEEDSIRITLSGPGFTNFLSAKEVEYTFTPKKHVTYSSKKGLSDLKIITKETYLERFDHAMKSVARYRDQ